MNKSSQFSDTPSVPVWNWRTAGGLDFASFSLRAPVPGGDYVDFLPLPKGQFAFMLGETDAKGPLASWASACVRGAVRGFIGRGHVSPMTLAKDLNRIIYEICSLEQIVSLLYAHYDAKTSVLTYVNAGHEAALLLQSGHRNSLLLDLGGPVLGLKATSTYSEGSVQLHAGDRIVAFTTGVMDALVSAPGSSAEAELLEIAREHETTDSSDLAGAVLDRISYSNETSFSRDRSLVIISKNDMMPGSRKTVAERDLASAYS